jgi:hypothetical protein
MSTKQIVALLQSRLDGDDEQFLSIALQVAAQQARQGNQEDAEALTPPMVCVSRRVRSKRP